MANRCCTFNNSTFMSKDEHRLISFYPFIINSHHYIEDVNLEALKNLSFDGFYYDYRRSRITCYYCDALFQYENFIKDNKDNITQNLPLCVSPDVHRRGCNRQRTSIAPFDLEIIDEFFQTLKYSIDLRCKLCNIHQMVVLLPCMHMYCCAQCLEKMNGRNCPSCNMIYHEAKVVYIAQ